jgi:hypothetical protein
MSTPRTVEGDMCQCHTQKPAAHTEPQRQLLNFLEPIEKQAVTLQNQLLLLLLRLLLCRCLGCCGLGI